MTGEGPRFHRALGWWLAAALLTRAALAARAPIIEVDGAYWAGLAAALERGDLRHGFSTAWPPLYPAFVALAVRLARLAGAAPEPVVLEACARAASVLAGTLVLVPLHALARRLLTPRAATVAVVLAAFHPRLLQYSAAALSEATFTLCLVAGLAWLVAREQESGAALGREAAAGACFGLAYLARPEGLPLAAALWVGGLFVRPRAPVRSAERIEPQAAAEMRTRAAKPRTTRFGSVARLRPAFAIATLVVALPWLVFLHGALGRWSLGEKGEYNFWRAFAAEYARDFPPPAGLAERVNESPERAPPPPASGVRVAEFAFRHPDVVLSRCARNLVTILASTLPAVLYWPLVPFAALAILRRGVRTRERAAIGRSPDPGRGSGSAGVGPTIDPAREQVVPGALGIWPVAVALAAMPLLYAPFSVDRRFLVPAVPLLLLACAAGIVRVESWLAAGAGGAARARRAVNAALVTLAALAVAYAAFKGAQFDDAPEHRRAGEWLRRNDWRGNGMPPGDETRRERPAVMSRKPWVAFYSGGLIVTLPDAAPESLLAIARARGAGVLVADARSASSDRPRLAPLVDPPRPPDGLVVLHREPGPPPLVLYRTVP